MKQFRLQISPNFYILVVRGDMPAYHKLFWKARASSFYKRESSVPNFEEIRLLVQAAVAAKKSLHLQSPLTTSTPSCNPFIKCCAYFGGYVHLVYQISCRSIRQFRLQISPNIFLLVAFYDMPIYHKPFLGGRASALTKGKEVCQILQIQA